MKHVNAITEIPIEKVYHYELQAYKALCAANIKSGKYTPPVGPDYQLDIYTSDNADRVNIELWLSVGNKKMTVKIDAIAADGRWIYQNILDHKYNNN